MGIIIDILKFSPVLPELIICLSRRHSKNKPNINAVCKATKKIPCP
jgi:hypothetical protein